MSFSKKFLSLILIIFVFIGSIPLTGLSAFADDTLTTGSCGENVTYSFDSSTGTLTISGTGDMDFNESESPFQDNTAIKKVVINEGITCIAGYAFRRCTNISSVSIPNSVTRIGGYSFNGCESLNNISLSNALESIGAYSFSSTALTSIHVPDSVKWIEGTAFDGTDIAVWEDGLLYIDNILMQVEYRNYSRAINVKNGTRIIANSAFFDDYSSNPIKLSSLNLPDGLKVIGENAFQDSALSNIPIPDTVTDIGQRAFEGCTKVTSISLPNNITYIGPYTFGYCSSLKNIDMPVNLTCIDCYAFTGCSALTNISIPESVTSIGWYAFNSCSGLTNVTIPERITRIEEATFQGCTNLNSISFSNNIVSIGKNAFSNTKYYNTSSNWENELLYLNNTLIKAKSSIVNAEIKTNIRLIADEAFYYCSQLNFVSFSNSMISVGSQAFYGCSNLLNVELPNSVVTVGKGAFNRCSNLSSVVLSSQIKKISDEAFCYCYRLSNIIIPSSVTEIGRDAFCCCNNLINITIPDKVTLIGDYAFQSCGIKSIIIPASVKRIGYKAFVSNTSLQNIIFHNHNCEIDDSNATIYSGATISACSGTTAEDYANKYSRQFISIGHNYEETERMEPTETKSGYVLKICAVCNHQVKENLMCYRTHEDATRFADQQYVLPVAKSCVYDNTLYARFDKVTASYYSAFSSSLKFPELNSSNDLSVYRQLVSGGNRTYYIIGGQRVNSVWVNQYSQTPIDVTLIEWDSGQPSQSFNDTENQLSITASNGLFNDIRLASETPGFIAGVGLNELQPTNSNHYGTNKYVFYEFRLPYTFAQLFCEAKGGYLASVASKAENDSIISLVSNKERVYLGGKRNASGNFEWVNGEAFTYTNWYPGEPNNGAGAGQYFMQTFTDGQWDDCNDLYAENKSNQVGFVCEYEPESLSVSIDQDESHRITNNEIHIVANYPDGTTSDITSACEVTQTYINGNIEVTATAIKPNGETIKTTEQIPVEGEHTYTQVVVTEATCTKDGSIANICTVCKNRYDVTVPASGHDYQATKTVLPTCTTAGYTKYMCSVCGEKITDDVVAPLGHSLDAGIVLQEADCENAGSKIFKCSECDYSYTEEISAIGHDYTSVTVAPTCTKAGFDTYTCKNCGNSYTANTVAAPGHSYQPVVKNATCTQGGYTTYTCSTCGSSYTADYVNALGHDFGNYIINQDSGAYFDGTKTGTCSRCGVSNTVNVNSTTVFAQDVVTDSGKQIAIPVILKNNTGLMGFGFEFSYDASILTPVRVDYGDMISQNLDDNLEGDATPGKFKVIWYGEDELTTNGVLVNLVFDVAGNVEAETAIDIHCVPEDTFNENFSEVAIACEAINVTVRKALVANSFYSTLRAFDAKNNTATDKMNIDGEEKVFISVDNTVNTEQSYLVKNKISYDTSAFTFEGYADEDRNEITASNVESTGMINIIHTGTGSFNELTPAEVFDSLGVEYLVFRVNETVSKGDYAFTTQLETDNCFDVLDSSGCTLTLTESKVKAAKIFAEPVSVAMYDETISVPVLISDNPGIMGYLINFEYNPTQLQPIAAIKNNRFSGTFNDSIGVEDGTFLVLWSDRGNNYTNGELFTVTFRVVTDAGVISPVKVTYSQDDTFNEDYDDVVFQCSDFNVPLNCVSHQYELTTDSTAATCTQQGLEVYRCIYCGQEYTSVLNPLGHSYVESVTKQPRCEEAGEKTFTCSRCDDTYTEPIPALGHDWGAWEVTTAATCQAEGVEERVCSRDASHIESRPIAKLTHTPETIPAVAPTCTKTGLSEGNKCAVCGEILTAQETVAALGHDYQESITKAATCEKEGEKTFTCSRCSNTYTDSIPALGHNWGAWEVIVEAACDEEGVELRICQNDVSHIERRTIEKTPHTPTGIAAVSPTCTETGITEGSKCSVCGRILEAQAVVPALGHSYDETVTKEARCEDVGEKTFTCSRCNDTYTEPIPALGHDWGEWTVTTPATCQAEGVETRVCSRDAAHTETRLIAKIGHTSAEPVRENEVPATCKQVGSYDEVVYCSICHEELSRVEKTAEKASHQFDAVVTQPTCTTKGYTTYNCKNCEFSYIGDFTDMIAHTYTIIVHEPTTEAQGYTVHICTGCGYAYVDDITPMIPGTIHYIVPSLNELNTTITMKSDEAAYDITAANGVFTLEDVQSNVYRVYAKQKNSLTVCLGEYDTKFGEVVNNDDITLPLGDVNGDDVIDIADISMLLATGNYGEANTAIDLTGDGMITIDDIAVALQDQNYGKSSVKVV